MLTANEIRNVTFNKSMGGYKAAEVDVFIDQCADTVDALTKAKIELEKKLEVLADKLVEYREEEDSIRTALLSAQRLGDTVVREANHKAGLILEDANIKAEKIHETAKRNIQEEEKEFERIRKEITNFKARMLGMYKDHLTLIDALPELHEEEPKEPVETPETAAAPQSETIPAVQETQPVFESVEEPEAVAAPVAPVPSDMVLNIPMLEDDAAQGVPAKTGSVPLSEAAPVSRFGDLKFGDNYDIKKDEDEEVGFFKRRR